MIVKVRTNGTVINRPAYVVMLLCLSNRCFYDLQIATGDIGPKRRRAKNPTGGIHHRRDMGITVGVNPTKHNPIIL